MNLVLGYVESLLDESMVLRMYIENMSVAPSRSDRTYVLANSDLIPYSLM